jgi:hypothetical protein
MSRRLRISLSLIIAAIFGACTASNMRDALIGTWHAEGPGPNGEVLATTEVFSENGNFEGYGDVNGRRHWNYEGEWSLSRDLLRTQYTESDLAKIPVGTKNVDRIVEISTDYLIMENEQGVQRRFVRVQNQGQTAKRASPP